MNLQSKETMQQQYDSLEVYTFTTQATTYRFTSYAEDVEIDGNVYTHVPVKRTGFPQDMTQGIIRININIPITTFFAQYIISAPIIPVTVAINKYYISDFSQRRVIFNGTVNSLSVTGRVCNVECLSNLNELNRRIPRVFIQSFCNNSLYGPVCLLAEAAWRIYIANITVDASDNTLLSAPLIGAAPNDYFKLGIAEYEDDKHLITAHTGNQIKLQFPFRTLSSGSAMTLLPGCDKAYNTCIDKFDNTAQFTGMPWVPSGPNPVNWGVVT